MGTAIRTIGAAGQITSPRAMIPQRCPHCRELPDAPLLRYEAAPRMIGAMRYVALCLACAAKATPSPANPHPFPFSGLLAAKIRDHWDHNRENSWTALADVIMDAVCDHIANSMTMDRRLVDAIEAHLEGDELEGDRDAETECSVEDLERHRARTYALMTMATSGDHHVRSDAAAAVGTMLKRPEETDRYNALRVDGHTPASALSLILSERRVASMKTSPPAADERNGGAL